MLGNFNRTVLLIASVLLILGLIIIGIFILKNVENSAYPPVIGDCPDYWDVYYNNNQKKCRHKNINAEDVSARCRDYPVAEFSATGTSAADILCAKNKWAKSCNIHWDGITNNSQACVKTTI
jgi:hypothetical protein